MYGSYGQMRHVGGEGCELGWRNLDLITCLHPAQSQIPYTRFLQTCGSEEKWSLRARHSNPIINEPEADKSAMHERTKKIGHGRVNSEEIRCTETRNSYGS